jgi:hypothetical protein
MTCLPCPHCTATGGCSEGFDSYNNLCTICPKKTFALYGHCKECPNNALAAALLPGIAIISIAAVAGLVVAALKFGLITNLPTFSLTLANMIRLKQIGAALQILAIFAGISNILRPWFKSIAGFVLQMTAPVEVQPVCASWFSDLIHNEYYFVRSYIAFFALSMLSAALRYAHRVRFLRGRLSVMTFAKMQKLAALVVINTPVVVLPLALRPKQMLTSYFDKFHEIEKDWFTAVTSGFFLSLVSAALLMFVLHRTIKATSSQFKALRSSVLSEFIASNSSSSLASPPKNSVTTTTWEDVERSRPYVAAFCLQYTPCEYQHEEKVVLRKIASIVGVIAMDFFATGMAEGGCNTEVSEH